MESTTIETRQDDLFETQYTTDDTTLISARFLVQDSDKNILFDETANFSEVDGKWVAYISFKADAPVGEYQYIEKLTWPEGDKSFPSSSCNCGEDDGCALPIFEICENIDTGESS